MIIGADELDDFYSFHGSGSLELQGRSGAVSTPSLQFRHPSRQMNVERAQSAEPIVQEPF
jgi:hypothetical protein